MLVRQKVKCPICLYRLINILFKQQNIYVIQKKKKINQCYKKKSSNSDFYIFGLMPRPFFASRRRVVSWPALAAPLPRGCGTAAWPPAGGSWAGIH